MSRLTTPTPTPFVRISHPCGCVIVRDDGNDSGTTAALLRDYWARRDARVTVTTASAGLARTCRIPSHQPPEACEHPEDNCTRDGLALVWHCTECGAETHRL